LYLTKYQYHLLCRLFSGVHTGQELGQISKRKQRGRHYKLDVD
jgi:hypothetical protein